MTVRRMHRRRDGVVLLEVLVALAVLAGSGLALLAMTIQSEAAIAKTRSTADELRRATSFMESVSLWTGRDLDQHLGFRREGPFTLLIERTSPWAYRIELYRGDRLPDAETTPLLATAIVREER